MLARTAILIGVTGCVSVAFVACRSGGARSDAATTLPASDPGPSSEPTDPDAAWGPIRWDMTVDEATAALARFAPAVERLHDGKTGDDDLHIDFKWGTWEGTVEFDGCRGMERILFHRPSSASCGVAERATDDAWTQRFGKRSDHWTLIEQRWLGSRTVLVESRRSTADKWSVIEKWSSRSDAPAAATRRPIDAADGWRGVPWGAPFEHIRETLGTTAYTMVNVPGPWANGPTSPFDGRCAGPTKQEMRFEEGGRDVTIELGPEGCLLGVSVSRTESAPVPEEDRWGEPDVTEVESVGIWKDERTEAELVVAQRGPGREGPGWKCTQSESYRPLARPAPTRADGRPCSAEPPVELLHYLLQRENAAAAAPPRLPAGGIDLATWVNRLERLGQEEDEAGLRSALRAVHGGFDATDPFYGASDDRCLPVRRSSFDGVEVFRGQADDDPGLETAVLVRFTESEHYDEWCEEFWIGVFDERGAGPELVGAVRRAHVACTFAGGGVSVGFVGETPGPEAGLWVETPEVEACGTMVSYTPRRLRLRVGTEGLEGEWGDPSSAGEAYDRITGERFGPDESIPADDFGDDD